jgi:hypothetical protein
VPPRGDGLVSAGAGGALWGGLREAPEGRPVGHYSNESAGLECDGPLRRATLTSRVREQAKRQAREQQVQRPAGYTRASLDTLEAA